MRNRRRDGFTLVELLVVIATIAIVAAILLPVLGSAKARADRTACLNNLRQVNLAVRIYTDEANDTLPASGQATNYIPIYYRILIQGYVGVSTASAQDKVFACPADIFLYRYTTNGPVYVPESRHNQSWSHYSSYTFNGINQYPYALTTNADGTMPGISGLKLSAIKHPARTALVLESPARAPYSWHQPKQPVSNVENMYFNNSLDMASFVDGHASYIKMYWNSEMPSSRYDPPAGYEYQWSPD